MINTTTSSPSLSGGPSSHQRKPTIIDSRVEPDNAQSDRKSNDEEQDRIGPYGRRPPHVDISQELEGATQQGSAVIIFRQFVQLSQAVYTAKGRSEMDRHRGKAKDIETCRIAEAELRKLSKQFEYLVQTLEDVVNLDS
ncbi:MAG: hypothetical protein Q9213_005471 [Squamulea squamosa]